MIYSKVKKDRHLILRIKGYAKIKPIGIECHGCNRIRFMTQKSITQLFDQVLTVSGRFCYTC